MTIVPGKLYWMKRIENSKRHCGKRKMSIKKCQTQAELVTVINVLNGKDSVGNYLLVDYTLCGRGTQNSVRCYETGEPALNFMFIEATG